MGVFANVESAERIIMGIGQQINDAWRPALHTVAISSASLADLTGWTIPRQKSYRSQQLLTGWSRNPPKDVKLTST